MGSHFGLRKFYYTLGDGSAVQLNFPGRAPWSPSPRCRPGPGPARIRYPLCDPHVCEVAGRNSGILLPGDGTEVRPLDLDMGILFYGCCSRVYPGGTRGRILTRSPEVRSGRARHGYAAPSRVLQLSVPRRGDRGPVQPGRGTPPPLGCCSIVVPRRDWTALY